MLETKRQRVARVLRDMTADANEEGAGGSHPIDDIASLSKDHPDGHVNIQHGNAEGVTYFIHPGPAGEEDLVQRMKALEEKHKGKVQYLGGGQMGAGYHILDYKGEVKPNTGYPFDPR